MDALKAAAGAVLRSLVITDFVAVVTFANGAQQLCPGGVPCGTLSRARASVVSSLISAVSSMNAGGQTNMEAGLKLALDMFNDPERSANCHRALLVLTDGFPTVGSIRSTEGLAALAKERNLKNAVIFSYSLTSAADEELPRTLACENGGVWQRILDTRRLRTTMARYFEFFARLYASSNTNVVRWTEPYQDAFGAGLMTTASLAIYDKTTNPARLLGVAGLSRES